MRQVPCTGNTLLPDGAQFAFWEEPLVWCKTFHVAQRQTGASDDNSGTMRRPWRTISKAAAVLEPGQRVVVHVGVYRECVEPVRGGRGPRAMIGYEAAPGEKVVITGADVWRPRWRASDDYYLLNGKFPMGPKAGGPTLWRADLAGGLFEGPNVFCQHNLALDPITDGRAVNMLSGYELRRGQLFLGGRGLRQVNHYSLLEGIEDGFWVDWDGASIYLRLAGDARPHGRTFEITTRAQVFAPRKRFLSYIRVAGFHVRCAGNGIPVEPRQRGAVSASAGYHWIIENCEISHANTIGMDLGCGFFTLRTPPRQGGHVVRHCHVHHCGVCGIAAWFDRPNQDLLIEDNLIEDIGGLRVGGRYESAGVKIHYALNSLIRRNVFRRFDHCSALWLDGVVTNTRVTQNVFYGAIGTPWGACCVEISQGPVLIDNNLVARCENHGIYEHDSARVLAVQNLVFDGRGPAVNLRIGNPQRKDNFYDHPQGLHRVLGNILAEFSCYVAVPDETVRSDYNILGACQPVKERWGLFMVGNDTKVHSLAAWRRGGRDVNSKRTALKIQFDPDRLELRVTAPRGWRLPRMPVPDLAMPLPPSRTLFGKYRRSPDALVGKCVAAAEILLQADLLGRVAPEAFTRVGPLEGLPLDGAPVSVDPRSVRMPPQ